MTRLTKQHKLAIDYVTRLANSGVRCLPEETPMGMYRAMTKEELSIAIGLIMKEEFSWNKMKFMSEYNDDGDTMHQLIANSFINNSENEDNTFFALKAFKELQKYALNYYKNLIKEILIDVKPSDFHLDLNYDRYIQEQIECMGDILNETIPNYGDIR